MIEPIEPVWSAPVLLLNIGLGWWAIERADALGAAAVSSACYLLATVAFVVVYARVTGFTVGEVIRYRRSDFDMLLRALPLKKLGPLGRLIRR